MSLLQKFRAFPIYRQIEALPLFKRVPLHICIGLSIAIILDTAVQLFWKGAVRATADAPSPLLAAFATFMHPLFWLVVTLFLLQLANWLKVLEHADLSYSQPITSLSYISVGILSAVFLGEHITLLQVCGITLVLAGVWFISRTDHNTLDTALHADVHPELGGRP
ncbi:MAG TPA: EamA family transporter [Drouetiella sp.]|jgi:drug/metabolite transporter (DMT)-like permease